MPPPRGTLLIGTSSWADPGFVAEWYPPGLPADERLPWYALHFDAVEVNAGFYAIPTPEVTARWADATPPAFTFDVKLHQLLSRHAGRLDGLPVDLRDRVETTARGRVVLTPALEAALLDRTRAALEPLDAAGKLGVLLVQLSPTFKPGQARLEELDGLVERLQPWPVAVELRHRAWLHDERRAATLAWFGSRGVAFVGVDAPQGPAPTMLPPVDAVTRPDVAYLRLHGRNAEGWMRSRLVAERFAWRYADAELEEIRERAERLAEQASVVHVMANNNRGDLAPQAALRLRELAGQPLRVRTATPRAEPVDAEALP
jgi:uncharacterized protein YecE (DUF72 family)